MIAGTFLLRRPCFSMIMDLLLLDTTFLTRDHGYGGAGAEPVAGGAGGGADGRFRAGWL